MQTFAWMVVFALCTLLSVEAPAQNTEVALVARVPQKKLRVKKHAKPIRRVNPSIDKDYAPPPQVSQRMADAVLAYKECMYGTLPPDKDRIEHAIALNLVYRNSPDLRGSAEKIGREVCLAEALGLERYETQEEINSAKGKDLFPLSGKYVLMPDDQIPVERRYARKWTKEYVEELGADLRAHLVNRYQHDDAELLRINSLVRSIADQVRQGSPAKCKNEICSTHLTGTTVDISNNGVHISLEAKKWIRERLLADRKLGKIIMIQEFSRPHYHVFVVPPEYRPKEVLE